MAVQQSTQTRIGGMRQLTSRHFYICLDSVSDFMKDVRMSTCKLSSGSTMHVAMATSNIYLDKSSTYKTLGVVTIPMSLLARMRRCIRA